MGLSIDASRAEYGPPDAVNRLGINVNHLTDGMRLHNAGQSLADALREMGVRWLRFPGGEKADAYLWSSPPCEVPRPRCARTGPGQAGDLFRRFLDLDGSSFASHTLGFDDFIALCHDVGAEPIVVVAYDSWRKEVPPGGSRPTREELLGNACSWVRYANRTQGYGVRRWEIGNESYLDSYNGAVTASEYARDIRVFADAMRKEDDSILIGANGPNDAEAVGALDQESGARWWRVVLSEAAEVIDFLSIHDYPCMQWMSYDRFLAGTHDFRSVIRNARNCLELYCGGADAKRIEIAITETNSADWYGHPENLGWPHINTIGHALVLFEMIAEHLLEPRLVCTLVWNTRWIYNDEPGSPQLWDALRSDNSPNPTGQIMKILGERSADRVGRIPVAAPLGCYVAESADCRTFLLVNRDLHEHEVVVTNLVASDTPVVVETLQGNGPDDTCPAWSRRTTSCQPRERFRLPAVSITVVRT